MQLAAGELRDKIASPWILFRLVNASAEAGLAERARPVAASISDAALRGRAQLAILKQTLASTAGLADVALVQQVDRASPAQGIAMEVVARHNARRGEYASVQKLLESDEWSASRPLGQIGIALGLQDATK